jgi:hypothetical protein
MLCSRWSAACPGNRCSLALETFAATRRTPKAACGASCAADGSAAGKWRRQAPIGPFIVDFYCPAARLVVELDGSQHLDQVAYDARRTAYLERGGLTVIRFGSENIWGGGLDHVCRSILAACGGEAPHRPDADASGLLSPLRGARATA